MLRIISRKIIKEENKITHFMANISTFYPSTFSPTRRFLVSWYRYFFSISYRREKSIFGEAACFGTFWRILKQGNPVSPICEDRLRNGALTRRMSIPQSVREWPLCARGWYDDRAGGAEASRDFGSGGGRANDVCTYWLEIWVRKCIAAPYITGENA